MSNTQSGRRLSFTDPQYKYSVEGIQTTHTTITGLAMQIGLTWLAPLFNGGATVLDYRIWTDSATGSTFTVLVENVVELSYTATTLT